MAKKEPEKLKRGGITCRNGRYYYRCRVNGKRVEKRIEADNLKEAMKKAREMAEVAAAESKDDFEEAVGKYKGFIKDFDRLPLTEAWDKYDKNPNKASPKTVNIYLYYKAYFRDFVDWAILKGYTFLDEVTDEVAFAYVNHLKRKKIGVDTHNKRVARVGHVFRTLNAFTSPETSDWKNRNFKRKKSEETGLSARRLPFEKDQEKSVLDVLADPKRKFKNKDELRVLLLLGAYTGQRMKDCCLLQWHNVDMKRRRIRVVQFKTGKTVSIPVAQQLMEALKEAKAWKNNSYLLPHIAERYLKKNKDGKDVGSGMVNKDVMRVIETALGENEVKTKLPERKKSVTVYGFHSLRHSFAQMCIDNNIPKAVAVSILGADSEILDRYYTHIGDEAQEQAMQLIAGEGSTLRQRHDKALEFLDGLKRKSKDIKELEKILRE